VSVIDPRSSVPVVVAPSVVETATGSFVEAPCATVKFCQAYATASAVVANVAVSVNAVPSPAVPVTVSVKLPPDAAFTTVHVFAYEPG
jgi:hypothetical protein